MVKHYLCLNLKSTSKVLLTLQTRRDVWYIGWKGWKGNFVYTHFNIIKSILTVWNYYLKPEINFRVLQPFRK